MKKLYAFLAAAALAFCANAAILTLSPGYHTPGVAGEIVAVEAATSNASATVSLKAVTSFSTYTNATQEVVSYETAYAIVYTNFDGEAAISTNVLRYVDYGYFRTNGVSKIISGPTRFDLPITNSVVVAKVPSATYEKTNDLAIVATLGHFGSVGTNAFLFGDAILVTGAAEGDRVRVIYK